MSGPQIAHAKQDIAGQASYHGPGPFVTRAVARRDGRVATSRRHRKGLAPRVRVADDVVRIRPTRREARKRHQ